MKGMKEVMVFGQSFEASFIFQNMSGDIVRSLNNRQRRAISKAVLLTLQAYKEAQEDELLDRMIV